MEDPLLRVAALDALESVPLEIRTQLALPALNDPVRSVRIEAARILAAVPAGDLTAGQQSQLEQGIEEYLQAQQAMAERPEAQVNMGNLYAARGMGAKAVSAYQTATELDPAYAPGTGTPVWEGLTSAQVAPILRSLAGINLVGMDVVEVAPPFDHANMTAIAGAHVAYELISLWCWTRR